MLADVSDTNNIWGMSGSEQAARIRDGTLTSVAVVGAVLQRIEKVNPQINAYWTIDEDALDAARRADIALACCTACRSRSKTSS
jgi:Asp-tRNA(Asn)/Glu-tRNA(Gln) amidotransferase A subunit family amidase